MQKHSKIGHVPLSAAQPCNPSAWAEDGPHARNFMRRMLLLVIVVRPWRMKFQAAKKLCWIF